MGKSLQYGVMLSVMAWGIATIAEAQTVVPPPPVNLIDQMGVDLASGRFQLPGGDLSIGTAESGLSRVTHPPAPTVGGGSTWSDSDPDNFSQDLKWDPLYYNVGDGEPHSYYENFIRSALNGESHAFFVSTELDFVMTYRGPGPHYSLGDARLLCDNQITALNMQGLCTVTLKDGTVGVYDMQHGFRLQSTTKVDGEVIDFAYYPGATSSQTGLVKSVRSSLGWMLKYERPTNGPRKVVGINLADTYCDMEATSCAVSAIYPTVTVNTVSSTTSISRNGIAVSSYTLGPSNITQVSPSGVTKTITCSNQYFCHQFYNFSAASKVSSVSLGASTWGYAYQKSGDKTAVTITAPNASSRKIGIGPFGQLWEIDGIGRKSMRTYDGYRQVDTVGRPETVFTGSLETWSYTPSSGYTRYTYDRTTLDPAGRDHANLTTITEIPKPGFSLANKVTTAHYILNCTFEKHCNKPDYVIDANGKRTDYTYDTTGAHGGVLTETGPADSSGVRPQTRYTYAGLYPKALNSAGTLVPSAAPVYRLIRTSTCRVATSANPAACVTVPPSADETVTEYEYVNNNLLLTKVTVRAGNANVANVASPTNVWQSTSYDYDVVGNQIMVDGPLPGTVDRSYTVYDALRRPVYEIGVDPDGAGTLPSVAIHHMYDIDGREYRTETGRGNGVNMRTCVPTAATCTYFAVTSYVQRTYDPTTGLEVKSITAQP